MCQRKMRMSSWRLSGGASTRHPSSRSAACTHCVTARAPRRTQLVAGSVSIVCMITSCYIISLATCFRTYGLTDSISELPYNFPSCDKLPKNEDDPSGNAICVLKPGGMIAIAVFLLSMFLHLVVFDQFVMRFALQASIKRNPLSTEGEVELNQQKLGTPMADPALAAGAVAAVAGQHDDQRKSSNASSQ